MQKKNLKESKGITLVALVITIIVLLILAGVAIATLLGRDNIITQAQRARDDYNEATGKEETTLDSYNEIIEQSVGKGGKSSSAIIGTWVHFENGNEEDKFQFLEGGTVSRTEKSGQKTGSWEETESNK